MKTVLRITPFVLTAATPRTKEYTLFDKDQPKLALRVHPTGKKSWVCWTRKEGKTRRITLGSTKELTPNEARSACEAFPSNKRPTQPVKSIPFSELWLAFREAKDGIYQPSTLEILDIYMQAQLLPQFGALDLTKITASHVAEWFYGYSVNSPGGANQALGHLCTLFNWARKVGHLPPDGPNPTAAIRRNRRGRPGRMLSADQLASLAEVLDEEEARYQDAAQAVRLILLTGCRSGEILRLRWSEVKADRLKLAHTKTGPREVLLNTLAIALLKKRRKRRLSPFVFPSQSDLGRSRASITPSWIRFKRRANLP